MVLSKPAIDIEQGGLAAAAGTEDCEKFAVLHLEVQFLDGDDLPTFRDIEKTLLNSLAMD